MPASTRDTATRLAKTRNSEPARRETKKMPNAIERAAVAWSLGKDGSWEGVSSGTMLWWAWYGRARSQTWLMAWFANRPVAAAARPDAQARFQVVSPGGDRSHRPTAITPKTVTPHVETR